MKIICCWSFGNTWTKWGDVNWGKGKRKKEITYDRYGMVQSYQTRECVRCGYSQLRGTRT